MVRRILAGVIAGVRLCLATRRFPLGGNLGREQQPRAFAVEWADADEGSGVRRLAISGVAPPNGRTWTTLRSPDVSVAACARDSERGVLDRPRSRDGNA